MRERLFVYVILCLATIIRFDFLVHSGFRIDSDEAIVGLMAKHILETGQVPVFYYGQHYMGSFEPLVAALSFSFLGVNEFALKIVPLCFSIIFLFLIYRLASILCSGSPTGPLTPPPLKRGGSPCRLERGHVSSAHEPPEAFEDPGPHGFQRPRGEGVPLRL